MINILIGDDHRIVREGLKQVLADAPDIAVAAEAETGIEVLQRVDALAGSDGLQAVLLDIALPGRDGMDVLQVLTGRWPQLPVLMLSTYPEKQYAVRCIRLGASGYLNKSANSDDMIAAVRKVAGGGKYVSAVTAEAMASALFKGAGPGPGTADNGIDALSHREHQVYRLLTAGKSVGEIGTKLGLASNTVSTYRMRILEKTGARNDVELVLYAGRHLRVSTAS